MTESTAPKPYPVRLTAEYSLAQSRWKALLRIFLAIPVLFFLALLTGGSGGASEAGERSGQLAVGAAGSIVVAIWVTIILRQRIPRWLFDFEVWVQRWSARAVGYLALLTDEYPAFEADYPIRYEVDFPDRLSRWRVLIWKLITSIPHFLVLLVLVLSLLVVVPIAWFAILITGRYPQGLHTYVTGVLRWGARVQAYFYSLTDVFPPFSLDANAGPGGSGAYRISAVLGGLVIAAVVAAIVGVFVALAVGSQDETAQVSYERLVAEGTSPRGEGFVEVHSGGFDLRMALDPADAGYAFLEAEPGHRLVEFRILMENYRDSDDVPIRDDRFSLRDSEGDRHDALLVTVNRSELAPVDVKSGDEATLQIVFEVPVGADPVELHYNVLEYLGNDLPFGEEITWEFQ